MLNARYSFAVLWQRLVAALSLIMAAALAPGVAAPTGGSGAGAIGSRASSGAAVASAAGALATTVVALIEGGGQQPGSSLDAPEDGPAKAKVGTAAIWQRIVSHHPAAAVRPALVAHATPPPTHAARSGAARAPPAA